jgi:hypothetical protein
MRPLSVCLTASALAQNLTVRRSRSRATSGLTTTTAPPPSVITQQSRRWSGRTDQGGFEDLFHRDRFWQEGQRVVLGVQ